MSATCAAEVVLAHPAASRTRTVLIERYRDRVDPCGGGVELAGFHLARALQGAGIGVRWYTPDAWTSPTDFAARVARSGADIVLPLIDSPAFARAAQALPPAVRRRIVRIWHDVSPVSRPTRMLPDCPRHALAQADGACTAAVAHPDAYGADVFFFDDAWTRCFARRRYIPWAVDHLPAIDHRAADGPIVLLIGKMRLEYALAILEACRALRVAVRIVFSTWSRLGRQSRDCVMAMPAAPAVERVAAYDLRRDHARVFGGASAALVLSQYRETFGFLAAEAVRFGIPVVAFAGSGGTERFASATVAGIGAIVELLGSGGHARLRPVARDDWGWRDVGAAYAALVDEIAAGRGERA